MTGLRRTPQTRLGDRARGPVMAYLVSSLPAVASSAAIAAWLVDHAATRDRTWWSLLMFGALLAAAPSLVRSWEHRFPVVLDTLEADEAAGWDVPRARRAIARVDRLFWLSIAFSVTFAVVFFAFYATPGLRRVGLDHGAGRAITAAVAGWFAYLVGVGLWIVVRCVTLVVTSLRSPPVFRPFRRQPRNGISLLSSFAAWTGAMLGVGSLAVPVWIEAGRGLPLAGAFVSAAGTGMFLVMGTVAFLIPQVMLLLFVRHARDRSIDEVGRVLERLAADIVAIGADWEDGKVRKAQSARLAELEAAFRTLDAISVSLERNRVAPPLLHTLPRVLTTVVFPVASLVVQAVTSSG